MTHRPKVLLVDDDSDLLELYQEMLSKLPSQPIVRTTNSGAKAIAMLDAEPFSLLLSDLNMPGMDGLQVLSVVRRKYPQMRTAVMTTVTDPQFRMRAYAIGLDLYLEKPNNSQATQMFLDCIESLLGQETQAGFRGMQSKSLMDIIQLECLSQSCAVLRITNGMREGRIWFSNGEIIDAMMGALTGAEAFKHIMSWRTGNFEMLPAEPNHPRAIFVSYHSLLLETVQALDEGQVQEEEEAPATPQAVPAPESQAAELGRTAGVEFVICQTVGVPGSAQVWSLDQPEAIAQWSQQMLQEYETLGSALRAGPLGALEAMGLQCHVGMTRQGERQLCVGFERGLTPVEVHDTMNKVVAKWVS